MLHLSRYPCFVREDNLKGLNDIRLIRPASLSNSTSGTLDVQINEHVVVAMLCSSKTLLRRPSFET